jgi:hypothetical protein
MPDAGGRLSDEEKQEITKKIQALWVGSAKNCPICGSAKWIVADHLTESRVALVGGVFAGPSYPMVMLISDPCGYTINFNALILGIMKKMEG